MKKLLISAIASLFFVPAAFAAGGGDSHIEDYNWSFEGPFGSFDQAQLQRGLQVYTEVCSACHGLKYVGFYALDDEGGPALPEDQVRVFATGFDVWDEKLRDTRPGAYADRFPDSSLSNAPDLSLMAKARAGFHGPYGLGINQIVKGMGGPEYIYSLLTGYDGHEIEEGGATFYGNHTFPGGKIAMSPPLSDELVDYALDDVPETAEQYAADVSAFLMWAAEPKMDQRKKTGMVAVLILGLLATLLFMANKLLWYPIKHKLDDE